MATKNGLIKKTALREYRNIRRTGLIAINLREERPADWRRADRRGQRSDGGHPLGAGHPL